MKSIALKSILLAGCFFLYTNLTLAQNWDADIVRSANSDHNTSEIWRFTNNSVKPISAGMPFVLLTTGLIAGDKKLQAQSLEMMAGLLLTAGITEGLKRLVNRPRPYQLYTAIYPDEYNDGKSFPSGHASVAFFTAASLSINHPKWYIVGPAYGWAGAVVYARLYYGQHNPSDLIGSFVVGTGSAWLSNRANKWLHKPKKKATDTVL